jgi:hypothetical protein
MMLSLGLYAKWMKVGWGLKIRMLVHDLTVLATIFRFAESAVFSRDTSPSCMLPNLVD